MAELKPLPSAEGLSLSRWSRLKRGGGEAVAAPTPEVVTHVEALAAGGQSAATELELPPISAISMAEDFTPFMQAKVPQALRQQALKALFKEPHFNLMDGLDTYIDDYTVFEPISPEVMATLSSWKTIMNPPQQVVTKGGYAVDAESEEGRAVLAARAELDDAKASLQPVPGDVQVPSPAARERAEGEGGDALESTLNTISPTLTSETIQLSDEAPATALTPTLPCRAHSRKDALAVSAADRMRSETPPKPRAAGEGAKPHTRYGKRVGDFSASTYAAAEQLALDSPKSELDQTASAAPKIITQ